ncbi:penicillin acylase family protein [Pseudomonas khavaziana]|uniref:Acyl-homoserine lactone acylase QuiP n=1 Tax=Pseudomonas khavaziana TaxID=2842351 RepID=A0ABZ2DK35_9PSED
MFRQYPLAMRFIFFLFPPLIIAGLSAYWMLSASLAQESGTRSVHGLYTSGSIVRNEQGIVKISAESDRDVYFLMGYAHAQDRLWQLNLQKWTTQGRMSEFFGSAYLKQDIFLRKLDITQTADSAWQALSPEAQATLTAYSDGINAWLAENHPLPPEFLLLNTQPERWAPVDSIAWLKFFALILSGNFPKEMERYLAISRLNDAQFKSMYPNLNTPDTELSAEAGGPAMSTILEQVVNQTNQFRDTFKMGAVGIGSNAWVISGEHSANGAALLANDPHLGLQTPSAWYVVSQSGDHLRSNGMSLVGLPLVVFGANENIAWAGTSMMADVQDGYIEQLSSTAPLRYKSTAGWQAPNRREESILVKPDFPVVLRPPSKPLIIQVLSTEHGPIISDTSGSFDRAISLQWTGLEKSDTTYESIYRINLAHDWPSFHAAVSYFVAPALNLLYADRKGNIGYQGAGRIPVRNKGDGQFPSPGGSAQYAWKGYIPFSEMPGQYNPKNGYIVSANNNMTPDNPHFISNDWAPPERANNIELLINNALAMDSKIRVETMMAMQLDVKSLAAKKLLPLLLTVKPENPEQYDALQVLRNWDGDVTRESTAAAIYLVWVRHLKTMLFTENLTQNWDMRGKLEELNNFGIDASTDTVVDALAANNDTWCKKETASEQSCANTLVRSLTKTIKELKKLQGDNLHEWHWGDIHYAYYRHTPFSEVSLIKNFFESSISNGGAEDTINVANAKLYDSRGYRQDAGPGFRQIVQLGNHIEHWYSLPTGQSGHPLSPHYRDMLTAFRDGKYFKLDFPNQASRNHRLYLNANQEAQ